jgi:hypothetical protein
VRVGVALGETLGTLLGDDAMQQSDLYAGEGTLWAPWLL